MIEAGQMEPGLLERGLGAITFWNGFNVKMY